MMTLLSSYKLIRSLLRKIRDDFVSAFSAQAAFFIILSFFPFVMFLLTLVQYVTITESSLLTIFTNIVPSKANALMVTIITDLYKKSSGTITSITAISALWSASRGFIAIIKGLNSVYGIDETRSYLKIRVISTLYTLVFAVMLVVTLAFLVFGNKLYLWIITKIPVLNDLALLVISLRTIVGLLLLAGFFLLIYIVIPNRNSTILTELPGALLTASGWMSFSYLYSFYIDNMGNYSYMYGSLTAIVLLMLWLYFCMYIMFIGAEVNVFLSTISSFSLKKRKTNKSTK